MPRRMKDYFNVMGERNLMFFVKLGRWLIKAIIQMKPGINEHQVPRQYIRMPYETMLSKFLYEMKKKDGKDVRKIKRILFIIFNYDGYNKNVEGFHINDLLQQLSYSNGDSSVIIDYSDA